CVRGQAVLCVDASAVATSTFPDGTTRLSRAGATVFRGVGVGAFAELVLTQESGAVKIPDDVPLGVAAVLGCAVQTGVGAVLNTAAARRRDPDRARGRVRGEREDPQGVSARQQIGRAHV